MVLAVGVVSRSSVVAIIEEARTMPSPASTGPAPLVVFMVIILMFVYRENEMG